MVNDDGALSRTSRAPPCSSARVRHAIDAHRRAIHRISARIAETPAAQRFPTRANFIAGTVGAIRADATASREDAIERSLQPLLRR
jgi:hypothetical protein